MDLAKIDLPLQSIPKAIKSEVVRTFLLATGSQLIAVFLIMGYLSYKDAGTRAAFLASSNQKSIGLMASTGDIFQLNNLIRSFVNDSTVMSDFVDENHRSLIKNSWEKTLPWKTFTISVLEGHLILLTAHDIIYANAYVGTLLLANKLEFFDWLVLCLVIILISIMAFLFQGYRLQRRALSVANYINDIRQFFYNSNNEIDLSNFFEAREKTDLIEIERLSEDIYRMLLQILVSVKLEKEASIGRIVGHLAHDLRAPLGVFERLLLTPDADIAGMRDHIKDSLNRLHSMINSLRFAEEENIIKRSIGKLAFDFSREKLSSKFSYRNISLLVSEKVPFNIHVDHPKIERAWLNLVSNAFEFAKTMVRIDARVDGQNIYIRVSDDGPGVSTEVLPRLYQRGATYGNHDGTGLGLAYVRQILLGHGGDLTYRREEGMTVFECFIPQAVLEEDQVATVIAEDLESKACDEIEPSNRKQVSICFKAEELNLRVLERLNGIVQNSYQFLIGFDENSSVVLTDLEEISDLASLHGVRPIQLSAFSDDEIVRRVPIRLGLKV